MGNRDTSTLQFPGYNLVRQLGLGGAAQVFLATDRASGHAVAIKVLSRQGDMESRSRFEREIALIRKLNHPGIIRILNTGQVHQQPYLIMPFMAGGDLELELGGHRPLHPDRISSLMTELCRSLAYAHEQGILHRDLKPANILFAQDRLKPILSDFGAARSEAVEHDLTHVGMTVGSPGYMSPEQIRGHALDHRTDIYGLGVIFYRMLTGAHPYQGKTALQVALAHLEQPIPQLPPALAHWQPILERCLAKNPQQRFADCLELHDAIDQTQAPSQQTQADADSRADFLVSIRKTGPWYRRRRHLHIQIKAEDIGQFQQHMQHIFAQLAKWHTQYGRKAYSCSLSIHAHPWIHQRIRELLESSRQENTPWGDLLQSRNPVQVEIVDELGHSQTIDLRPRARHDPDH